MLCSSRAAFVLLSLLTLLPLFSLQAQAPASDACSMPVFSHSGTERNLFNDQQEEWLGEFMDQSLRQDYHLIEDRDGYLQRIGERLLAQLPPTGVHYRFAIIDDPRMNSFGTVGGRIYIFRRLIAYAKNEDQLAGLLGHEIGHMIMHQVAIDFSESFRRVGITSVGDRQDVLNRWNQFKDNAAKIKISRDDWRLHEEQAQLIADRIGVYAMMRAGYDATEAADFADNVFHTKGKTGNFWTDLFGNTRPESKRLREIIKESANAPANCRAAHPDTASFSKWQQNIVEARRAVAHEELPGLTKKVRLQPPLRNEIENLLFSPDGKYLLAQDESSIFVLGREPFANLFTIDAERAHPAAFTPDSKSIVFYDPELRVQKWDIATGTRVFIQEVRADCWHTALSPNGELLACVTADRDLQIVEVQSGAVSTLKKKLYEQTGGERLIGGILSSMGWAGYLEVLAVQLRFSPDGRYLVAGHGLFMFAYDFVNHHEVKVPGKLQPLMQGTFVFTSPEEIFGLSLEKPRQAMRIQFPSGEILDKFPFVGWGFLSAVPNAPYVMIRPAGQAPIGAIDFSAKKVTLGYKTEGFAIFDKFFAGEDVDGLLRIYSLESKSPVAQAQLPVSSLTAPRASAFSSDSRWLAVSTRSRGAVWKLETGERIVYSPDFRGAFFDQDHLIVQFPKRKTVPPQVVELDPATLAETKLYDLDSEKEENPESERSRDDRPRVWQDQDLLLTMNTADSKKFGRPRLEARDVKTRNLLWELDPLGHWLNFDYWQSGNTIAFVVADYDEIKDAAKRFPAINAKLGAIRGNEGKHTSYLVDVFEARSHKELGAILVDTGNLSFKIRFAIAVGDNVFVCDSLNRTLVYSLASGEQRGKVFGRPAAVSAAGDKVVVESEPGVVEIYDTSSLLLLTRDVFSSRLARAQFTSPDNLLMLTADQTVYQLNIAGPSQKASEASTH